MALQVVRMIEVAPKQWEISKVFLQEHKLQYRMYIPVHCHINCAVTVS
jgi:hypothetical protein